MAIRSIRKVLTVSLVIFFLQALFLLPQGAAAPAKSTRIFLVHGSDGVRFEARLIGDEFGHILTTPDGCAIALSEENGDYCYIQFTPGGGRTLTSWRAGDPDTPAMVLEASRHIPHEDIARSAMRRRSLANSFRMRQAVTHLPERHVLVLLVEFSDLHFQFTREDFAQRLSSKMPASAASYFTEMFKSVGTRFSIDVADIVTLPNKYSYYGKNDEDGSDLHPHEMVQESCEAADPNVDFSRYDDDGDGMADNVYIFFAGGDEAAGAGSDHLWSHQWSLRDGAGINLMLDGVWINNYACSAELTPTADGVRLCGIGTFCHEYSHNLGLPDYYDTDYEESGGVAEALWRLTALMDGGNWNEDGDNPPAYNALDRYLLGLTEPKELSLGDHRLPPVHKNGDCYIMQTDKEGEYYLFECRAPRYWDSTIGGQGMLIYHVDRSTNLAGDISAFARWSRNKINCYPDHQCIDLIEPDPSVAATYKQARDDGRLINCIPRVFFPWEGRVSFTPDTDPSFRFWSGSVSDCSISRIRFDGDDILFCVTDSASERIPSVNEITGDVFQDAAIISWSADNPLYSESAWLSWGEAGKIKTEVEVPACSPGHYAWTLEGLTPRKAYNIKVYFKAAGSPVGEKSFNFTTKSIVNGAMPMIWVAIDGRSIKGSFAQGSRFPLRVYNLPEGCSVSWRFNGESITTAANGYFTPDSSGTLTAIILETDGTETLLQKKITLQ